MMNVPSIIVGLFGVAVIICFCVIFWQDARRSKALNPKPDQDDALFVREAIKVAKILGEVEDGNHCYNDGTISIFHYPGLYIPRVSLGGVTIFDINGFSLILGLSGQYAVRTYMGILYQKALDKEANDKQIQRDNLKAALSKIREVK